MKVLGSVAVLLALVLGGCADDAQPLDQLPSQSPTAASVADPEETGAITGVVVEESLGPVANATVTLEESARDGKPIANTTSDESGKFRFDGLAPATYRVRAIADGLGERSTLADVRAGEATDARIVLAYVATSDPYLDVYTNTGLIPCAYAIILSATTCSETAFGASDYHFLYNISQGHQAIVIETTWESQGVTMDYMIGYQNDTTAPWQFAADGIGTPILRKDLRAGQLHPGWAALDPYRPIPPSDQPFILDVQTYYDGENQATMNSTAGPACTFFLGYCTGTGIALDFRYTQYVTVFYHEAPADLAAYSVVPK